MYYSGDKRKIAIIGCGSVGMSFAFALLNSGSVNELVLIDKDRKKIVGEAMDLNHGLPFASDNMTIYAGEYSDCIDADIAVICAGAAQAPGETRIDLLKKNTGLVIEITNNIVDSGFSGIIVVATNPVDIMTRTAAEVSGFPYHRVFGTGTALDTSRLRFLLGRYFCIDPRNVHAYVIGEHGDSEFVPWSQAYIATKRITEMCTRSDGRYFLEDLRLLEHDVSTAAYKMIEAKSNTCYGIAMTLSRIAKAILNDENSVLTLSVMLEGEYGEEDVYVGIPCVLNRCGVQSKIRLELTPQEHRKFKTSCDFLKESFLAVDGIGSHR
ncbi:MAG: L-lactate dehydrogenase [Clostridia bacterium]|nr:L-lactate dehydrogenase [Clostridia bacterium]